MTRRVVITGMAGLSPIGQDWKHVRDALQSGRSGVARVPEWEDIEDLETKLGARVADFATPESWPRKKTRTMGRVSLMAARAAELALEDAGLRDHAVIASGRAGVSYGSSSGSPPAIAVYARRLFIERTLRGIGANDYLQIMSHTCASNIANLIGTRGRIVPTCTACTSGSQGIGFGYEAIKFGQQDVMLTGGAEELHEMDAAVFDILFSATTRNDEPTRTPRPFDAARDGLVVGEGAGCLVLEALEHARSRGARIRAEVLGYGTNCDGRHMTNPHPDTMQEAMRLALADAGVGADEIGYVNAHGTATVIGDIAESSATFAVFGGRVPFSSLKGHLGHTLGACGALEAWMSLEMIGEGWVAPTLNLDDLDPRCAPLDYVRGAPRAVDAEIVMSNNFAFGGVNTSLVFRRWSD
ncbi:MAG: beta-ketoacyl-ACP synthase [Myxococcales bacterium]|nr:beta-ketoacyl-ACP synthase [Myxococcales bacterium]MDH5305774.1 beta-ketoacyl-ACP synthase [Myxococcales bacterium]MDH5565310.1 beta-ketoacyl-ACP synthase [Myxococcales bacterium]